MTVVVGCEPQKEIVREQKSGEVKNDEHLNTHGWHIRGFLWLVET